MRAPSVAGHELALLAGADAREHPGLELEVLVPDLQRRPAAERSVDLLLLVVGVVVLGVHREVRRQLDHLDPERA